MVSDLGNPNKRRDLAQRSKGGFPQFILIFLCALAALREIFFLKKDMERLRSQFGDSIRLVSP